MQTSPVFHSTSLCSGNHRFGGLEMVSSQNSEEREKETSPRMHPEAFRPSGSQSPDLRLVSDVAPPWHAEVVGRGFQAPPGVGLTPVTRQPGHRCCALFASLAKSGRGQRCQWPERFRVGGGCGGTSGAVTFHLPFREHLSVLSWWGFHVQNKSVSFYPAVSVGLLGPVLLFWPLAVF